MALSDNAILIPRIRRSAHLTSAGASSRQYTELGKVMLAGKNRSSARYRKNAATDQS